MNHAYGAHWTSRGPGLLLPIVAYQSPRPDRRMTADERYRRHWNNSEADFDRTRLVAVLVLDELLVHTLDGKQSTRIPLECCIDGSEQRRRRCSMATRTR